MKEKKRLSFITVIIIIIISVIVTATSMYFVMSDEGKQNIIQNDKTELEVSFLKADEIFNWLPKIYVPLKKPFDDVEILQLVMSTINKKSTGTEIDFSEKNINSTLLQLFGPNVTINKGKVTDISMPYCYSSYENEYVAKGFGNEGLYQNQVIKSATQTVNEYYIEAYILEGEIGLGLDENGQKMLNLKDNKGKTINVDANSYQFGEGAKDIVKEYKDRLPVMKYTLQKDNDKYFIIKTEIVK